MAKKTIISDFSALKGKVIFSERATDTMVSPKVTPAAAPKPKESDKGLKLGQSVVLMDSNLRGKIIGLGKTYDELSAKADKAYSKERARYLKEQNDYPREC